MSSTLLPQNDKGLSSNKYFLIIRLCQILAISGITIYLISIYLLNNPQNLSSPINLKWSYSQPNSTHIPTNVSHLMFGLLGSAKTWKHRKTYIEAWWRPNVTRGYVYLDTNPAPESVPWSPFSPPYRICKDTSSVVVKTRGIVPLMIRMNMAILEIFREDHEDMRWIIMGDDDTMFFVDNLVDVLGRYDHNDYIYIGDHSETMLSNFFFSFDMGFGGGGIVLSYALAKAFVETFEWCLATNPSLMNTADFITMACVEDLGVSLTVNKGIHQTDLVGDISGFLSSHPLTPILSLHHFDVVDPLYPSKDRFESAKHLMSAANADQSRLVQQKICYNRQVNWTFSVSWGYSAHIYENIIPRSMLSKPLETFRPWIRNPRPPHFIFSTRPLSGDPCVAPHWFFLDKVDKKIEGNEVVTSYVRARPRGIAACEFSGNISAEHIGSIRVYSPATKPAEIGRSECCDVIGDVQNTDTKEVKIKIRQCMDDEIIG